MPYTHVFVADGLQTVPRREHSERRRRTGHRTNETDDAIAYLVAVLVQPAPDDVVRAPLDLDDLDASIACRLERCRRFGSLRTAPRVVAVGVENQQRRSAGMEMMSLLALAPD